TLSVTTSATVAGRGTGTLRVGLSGSSWLYRDYSFHVDEAPEAPGAPTGIQKPAGRIDLAWGASTTTTNLAGYDVYRSSGGAYTKLTATPQAALTYSDTATVDGTAYTYKIHAVSSGPPVLDSLDSTTVTKDTVAPGAPTASYTDNNNVADVVAGAAEANASISVTKTAPAPSSGYSTTADGAGSYSVAVAIVNGKPNPPISVTYTITATDAAGNTSAVTTLVFSDTH